MNLSVKDAAVLLSVSEKTIYRWLKQNILPTIRIQGSYRFNRAELLEWATSRRLGVSADAFSEPESEAQPLPTLSQALEAGGIFYRIEGQTRDEVLADAVSHLRLPEDVDRQYLSQVLLAREQLASTAIGAGIAIPHPRSPGLLSVVRPTVTLCFLEQAIDYHALDGQAVNILLIILSPNLRSHLHLLSRLGFVLQFPAIQAVLQDQDSRERIFAALASAERKIRPFCGETHPAGGKVSL
ncbi:MAG: PTS sugar transporter subunit IIA [Geoalkalibacter sp.]|jgi:PTS system nitrogen regulatory IIA component|uniref:PTS sugar transporter subunit IIA n=1 Tax=Geoalkalibacter sp. TaxID=3041440 RepID=UPI003D0BFFC0